MTLPFDNDSSLAFDYQAGDHRKLMAMLHVQEPFIEQARVDFAYCLDAPPSMPAGACERAETDMETEIYACAVQQFANRDPD